MSNLSNELEYDNLSDWLAFCVKQVIKDLFICLPGIVQSYNAESKRAVILPAVKQVMTDGKIVNYPTLFDVPVMFPSGGGFSITTPLTQGDAVLVIFSQRDIEDFKGSYKNTTPRQDQICGLKDGIALAGFGELSTNLATSDGISIQNKTATSFVTVENNKITVTAPTVEINSSQQLQVTSPDVTINGSLNVTGGVSWSGTATGNSGAPASFSGGINNQGGDIVSDNISLTQHTHSSPAGGNTGPPQ